ncbi:MAG: ATP-binding cassette domain-containing protein [Lachnospiraceae bacterium]|nr:ATP-binding cassette domain-containing protein [Lachnospiraceae bacterium]
MELLRVENLNFAYSDGKQALENISFSLEEGEMLCVCGPTGSGKSTLLRLLKRELSPRGTKNGVIYLNGRKQDSLSEFEAATEVGFVMQRPDMQIVTDKVWHELAFGLENIGVKQDEIRRRVCEIAGYFGMESWFDRSTDSLSGGQKQLLNLASVMVMQPSLLILDEPVSQLDPIAASDLLATVKKLCSEFGITVIAAEQRLEELIPASDKILALKDGRIVTFGETRECVKALMSDEHFAVSMPASAKLYRKLTGVAFERKEALSSHKRSGSESDNPEIPLSVGEGRRFLKNMVSEIKSHDSGLPEEKEGPGTSLKSLARNQMRVNLASKEEKSGTENVEGNDVLKKGRPEKEKNDFALEFREVYLKYERAGRDILQALSFKVRKGEIFCMLGGNGAGKSTAVSAAAGLVKPYTGKIKVFGKNIRDYRGQELYRECVALLPQDVQTVFLTDDINGRHPYDLSGGEQQLAALDIVLATKPRLLLLDEPTKGLDAVLTAELVNRLRALAQEGVTIVIVSHDVEFAACVADRCSLLFNGEVVSVSDSRDFFAGNYFYTTALSRITRGIVKW